MASAPRTDPITLVGLVLESAAGLRRALAPGLDDQLGVGGQSFELLIRLARSDGHRLRMSDLAHQSGLSPSGLSRAVDRLVEAGLARRESCPNDRRGTFASLTERGIMRMEEALARHRLDVHTLLEGVLSEEEQGLLAALLERLRDRVHPGAGAVTEDACLGLHALEGGQAEPARAEMNEVPAAR
ncbi:MAG: MarR family transcriptional regulator [Actinomycetota bacterium]|nr:MarR family transcriptional regulator [Actinomycetota bacterium]